MELQKMRSADYQSALVQLLATCRATAAAAPKRRQAVFKVGQAVLQWWAPWFQHCEEGGMPKTYKKNQRPMWFSGEILCVAGWMHIVYAGQIYTGYYCYYAY